MGHKYYCGLHYAWAGTRNNAINSIRGGEKQKMNTKQAIFRALAWQNICTSAKFREISHKLAPQKSNRKSTRRFPKQTFLITWANMNSLPNYQINQRFLPSVSFLAVPFQRSALAGIGLISVERLSWGRDGAPRFYLRKLVCAWVRRGPPNACIQYKKLYQGNIKRESSRKFRKAFYSIGSTTFKSKKFWTHFLLLIQLVNYSFGLIRFLPTPRARIVCTKKAPFFPLFLAISLRFPWPSILAFVKTSCARKASLWRSVKYKEI